jgi:hypothetical protein
VDPRPSKPLVFVASPYTKGDPAVNVHYQCEVFDRLLSDGVVLPLVPLWTHFQHTVFPRPYLDWVAYDQEILKVCDCCLRLTATSERLGYMVSESTGADAEVSAFRSLGRPVFFSIEELYLWVRGDQS